MSVATVADNKTGKKPHYKDYVSFLENYRNGKKDEQNGVIASDSGVSFSLNNSSNNSSSSVYSDLTEPPRSSFKEYLESYSNKKYSPVQPPAQMKKQEHQQPEMKTVKTEVFLEIHSPPSTVTKVVDITSVQNTNNVSKVSKIFENNVGQNGNAVIKTVPPSGKVNTFSFGQKNAELKQEQRKISVGEVSRKFDGSHHKVTLKKSHSISEKSRVFEDSHDRRERRDSSTSKTNGCLSPKPPINNVKPVLALKLPTEDPSPKLNGSVSPKHTVIKQIIVPKAVTEALVLQLKEETPSVKINNTKPVMGPKPVTETVYLEKSLNIPPPPPFQNPVPDSPIALAPPTAPPPPPPVPQPPQNGSLAAPPPPPPPPANFSVRKVQSASPKSVQKVITNGSATLPRRNDMVDGVIDKNDPRFKRLVYGALREMYGSYHDKANDYIATLPRNRVKKNNGLDSIIDSIASQGGLEKLNGRANPSVETD